MDKTQLRRIMRAKQNGLSAAYCAAAGSAIARAVLASEEYRQAQHIFCYVSMPAEPDTAAILQAAWAAGKQVYLPRCGPGGWMEAVPVASGQPLAPGRYGIAEPPAAAPAASPAVLQLAIVPCVAAGPHGERLGHGAGYYDRFLPRGHMRTLCLCFAQLLSAQIPMQPQDIAMDVVVTEQGVYRRGNAAGGQAL